jgi:hypothetical protein
MLFYIAKAMFKLNPFLKCEASYFYIFIFCFCFFDVNKLNSQELIWGGINDPNSTFDGGLNDWTVVGVYCSPKRNGQTVSSENALWKWVPDSLARSFGRSSESELFNSPTIANGAMIFDSGFLANGGQPLILHNGTCPVPHKSELISPLIDLSAYNNLLLSFFQYYRRGSNASLFLPDDVATFIEISNDSGITWTSFLINESIEVGKLTNNPENVILEISEIAAGYSNVLIKFVWEGSYAFWMIDDVQIFSLPENNLSIDRHFNPITSVYTPKAYSALDTFAFVARVNNFGGNNTNPYIKVSITNATNTQTFWADSAQVVLNRGVTAQRDSLPFTYVPNELAPGEYRIRYEVYQPGVQDFDPSDNFRVSPFFITDSVWQAGALRVYNRIGGDPQQWGFGALFQTDSNAIERFKVESLEASFAGNNGAADLNGKNVDFFVLEILNSGFFGTGTQLFDGTTNEFAAYAELQLNSAMERQIVSAEVFNGEDEEFVIENGKTYFVMADMEAGVLMGWDNQFVNYPVSLQDNFVILTSRLFLNGAFATTFRDVTPFLRLNLSLITSVDNTPLPEASVTLMPNPASSVSTVKIDLEKASNITITLSDISGKVINYQNFSNVTQMTHDLNVNNLAAGIYIVRVASEYGTRTQKLVVAK